MRPRSLIAKAFVAGSGEPPLEGTSRARSDSASTDVTVTLLVFASRTSMKTAARAVVDRTARTTRSARISLERPNDQAQPRRDARSALREVRRRRRAPSAGAQGQEFSTDAVAITDSYPDNDATN